MIEELSQPYDKMILARTSAWLEDYDSQGRERLSEGITLSMRDRGDYYGYFYNRSTNSQWRPYTGKGMVTYPIIGRAVKAKTATAVSTNVQIQVEAVRDVPEKQAASDLARNIAKYCREKLWSKPMEATLATLGQLHRFSFIYNTYSEQGGVVIDVPERRQKVIKTGETNYVCHSCGFEHGPEDLGIADYADQFKDQDLAENAEYDKPQLGPSIHDSQAPDAAIHDSQSPDAAIHDSQSPDAAIHDSQAPQMGGGDEGTPAAAEPSEADKTAEHTAGLDCPNCGDKSLVLESRARHEKVNALTGNYIRKDCGFMESRIISPLLLRFDTYPAIGFEYQRSGWFNYHPLVPAYEIIAMAPHLAEKLEVGPQRWSESARLHYELNNATNGTGSFGYKGNTYALDELVEPNIFWIQPHACVGWKCPEDWQCMSTDGDGNTTVIFDIKQGETIEDAHMRQYGEFSGHMVITYAEEVLAVGNASFLAHWVGNAWMVDAQSAFPKGSENLIRPQDAATNVLALVYAHVKRRSAAALVVDPMGGFTEKAIANAGQPGATIVRQPVAQTDAERNWQHYLGYLEPGELGQVVLEFVQLIIEIAKEESGVFNETVGNVENTETLGGRQMALTQSLGLMTPTQQNKGKTLTELYYVWLELWQKNAPDEAYELIKGTFEEEWKPQDVAAFKALDIRRELLATVVEGTDVPRTLTEQEQRYMAAVQFGLFVEPNPLPREVRQRIVKGVLGIDLDLGNYEANKRLAARRYEFIKQELALLDPGQAMTVVPDPMTGFPVRKLRPEIIASMAQDPRTAPRQTDEHLVFIEYWIDQINGLAGSDNPNEPLIAALEEQISMHRAFVGASAAQAAAVQNVASQPVQPQLPAAQPMAQQQSTPPMEAGIGR